MPVDGAGLVDRDDLRRPTRSDRRPETKFITPFTIPKETMKAKMTVIER
ncbi:hypothetical protein [Pontivivens nitratireducens]|nr:hypothetical protein [Pontibrevibacter nitratireducens]